LVTPLMSPFVLSLSEASWWTKDTLTRFLLSLPKDSVQTVRCSFCVLRMIDSDVAIWSVDRRIDGIQWMRFMLKNKGAVRST